MLPECEQFPENTRLRAICEGNVDLPTWQINVYRSNWGLDPFPDDSDQTRPPPPPDRKEVAVRKRIVFPPSELTVYSIYKASESEVPRPPRVYKQRRCCGGGGNRTAKAKSYKTKIQPEERGPGSHLIDKYRALGMPHCPACSELAAKMNAWGPEGCRSRIDEIVADIFPRALIWVEDNHKWIHRILPKRFEEASIRLKIRSDVMDAIKKSEDETKARKPLPLIWAVGVTTAPRRQVTLPRSLESLANAGWKDVYLFSDGPVETPDIDGLNLTVINRSKSSGIYSNWILSATELWLRHPNAERILIVQDDTIFCRGVREYLEQRSVPKDGLISLYTAKGREANKPGFAPVSPRLSGMGALAWLITPKFLHALLGDRRFLDHRISKNGHKHIDVAVSQYCVRNNIPQYHHTPSLAQHIGKTSTVGHDKGTQAHRQAPTFPGEDFDARSLLSKTLAVTDP